MLNRKCVDGGVGTGIPGCAFGGGPGGQGTGPDPGGGGGGGSSLGREYPGPGGSGVSSTSVSTYSITTGCSAVDVVELGAVGELCWVQDTIINAASETAVKGAINLGEVNDIGYS
jgi:hypothetical protein